jgi:sugar phosphate isomerase/epimerase
MGRGLVSRGVGIRRIGILSLRTLERNLERLRRGLMERGRHQPPCSSQEERAQRVVEILENLRERIEAADRRGEPVPIYEDEVGGMSNEERAKKLCALFKAIRFSRPDLVERLEECVRFSARRNTGNSEADFSLASWW